MKYLVNNKLFILFVVLLIIANITTLLFYWGRHFNHQKANAPKEFLAAQLHFTEDQKRQYFDLAKEHHKNATKIRQQVKRDKELLFQLLKSEVIVDSSRNSAAFSISSSLQALDILTFEHFRQVKALCTKDQKPKFDALIREMFNAVNR